MAGQAGGVGARLRAGREKMSLTVLQVAERIHTDPRIVEAIEADNYEALGAPVYARGHIRHYAELVGESATELIGLYSNLSKVGQPDLTQIVKAPSPDEANRLVAPAMVVIGVFAVAGAIWWVSALSKKEPPLSETHVVGGEQHGPAPGSGPDTSERGAPPQPTGVTQAPSPGAAPAPPPAAAAQASPTDAAQAPPPSASQEPAQPAAPAERDTSAPAASTSAHPTQAGTTARETPPTNNATTHAALLTKAPTRVASAAPTSGRFPAEPVASAGTAATAAPHSKNQAQVTLHYSADSWTEVYDATGARLFYDVGSANSTRTIVGTPPLRVVLGNASGVAVQYNGHETPVANLALPDGSVQFSINRSGRVARAKPVADGG